MANLKGSLSSITSKQNKTEVYYDEESLFGSFEDM